MKLFSKRLSSLAWLLVATPLVAQSTNGTIQGQVKDPKGSPIAKAKLVLTSPSMLGARTVESDASGNWRAPLLPVGSYRVIVTKDGFIGSEAQNIRVGLGAAVRQDLVMKPVAQASTVVEVVANTAEVEKNDTKVATNIAAEALETIPVANRGLSGAADIAPGFVTGSNGQLAVRGSSTQNTMFRVNGIDIKDDTQGVVLGKWYVEDAIEDIQAVVSPLHARNGRALGGAVNAVTRSGGNTFAGSIRASYDRQSWNTTGPRFLGVDDTLNRVTDITMSGPVVKDLLWFAYSGSLSPTSRGVSTQGKVDDANYQQRTLNANIDGVVAAGPGAGYGFFDFSKESTYLASNKNSFHEIKLTGAVTANHTLEFSLANFTYDIANRIAWSGTRTRPESRGDQKDRKLAWTMSYKGVLSESTFLEARVQRARSWAVYPKGDPRFSFDEVDLWGDVATGAKAWNFLGMPFGHGQAPWDNERNNKSGNLNLKMFREFAGSHEFDVGMDYFATDFVQATQRGPQNAVFRVGGAWSNAAGDWRFPTIRWTGRNSLGQSGSGRTGLAPYVERYYGQDGIIKNSLTGLYLNDAWTVNEHWNVMLGLRYDMMKVNDSDGRVMTKPSDFSPRLQVKYDLNGDGKHVLSTTAARYNGDINVGFTGSFAKSATSKFIFLGWSGIGNQPLPGDPGDNGQYGVRWVSHPELVNLDNYKPKSFLWNGTTRTNAFLFGDSTKQFDLDPNLKAPYADEVSLAYRRSFGSGDFFKVTYVRKEYKRDWAISTEYKADQMVLLNDPAGLGLAPQYGQVTRIFNSDELKRVFNSIELEWASRFSSVWSMGGNYTYGHLVGNSNGGDNPSSTFRDNGVAGLYNNREFRLKQGYKIEDFAPEGRLSNDQAHRARVWLTADVPFGRGRMSFSWMGRYDSGSPFSLSAAAPTEQPQLTGSYAYPAPNTTFGLFLGGRGQYTTMDTFQVDFKMAWTLPIGFKSLAFIGDFKVDNFFNHRVRSGYDTTTMANQNGYLWGAFPVKVYIPDARYFGTSDPNRDYYWTGGRSLSTSFGLRF